MPGKRAICTHWIRNVVTFMILCCVIHKMTFAQEAGYRAQSLFIYQFIKYITWPEEVMGNDLVIGVYGNCPIVEELRIMASLKTTPKGNPITVIQINTPQEMQSIHILYIPASKSRDMASINLGLGDSHTLTVAERDGMAKKGAMISFIILENGILKFEINKTALDRKKLIISPELLKLGFIVG